jgi:hypothetical protein
VTATFDDVMEFLRGCTPQERRQIADHLRQLEPAHQPERDWNISASDILDAIASGSDLIQRGIRGVIADKAFYRYALPVLQDAGWRIEPINGDRAYDADLRRGTTAVTVQVKMQRRSGGVPMTAKSRFFTKGTDFWVVETQKTRAGLDSQGQSTRPYRFGEFDILAVNLHPSSGDWSKFLYTVSNWLIPDPQTPGNINKYQRVAKSPNDEWTDKFETVVDWLKSGRSHTIGTQAR